MTGTLLARRALFEAVGLFDSALGHGDSTDWFCAPANAEPLWSFCPMSSYTDGFTQPTAVEFALVDPGDWRGLAEAIEFLLAYPRAGEAARRRIQTVFSFERYIDAYDGCTES